MSPGDSAAMSAPDGLVIDRELAWFETVRDLRFKGYGEGREVEPDELPGPPRIDPAARDPYSRLLREFELEPADRLVLILALTPHVAPELLDSFLLQNSATGRRFTEFGGLVGQSHGGLLPTVESALFLIAGSDLQARLAARRRFDARAPLLAAGVVSIDHRHPDEPPASATINLSREHLEELLTGEAYVFTPGHGFPAERITTALNWNDLVLDRTVGAQIDMIGAWIRHSRTLLDDWGLAARLKPGYRCLFHGAPGTGKTLTACLLGKQYGVPVYRVDLSRIVSKWIGETEKNLAGLFDQAQSRNWILFFDEAEALFGKRTEASTANDRAANQQIAYLLQRLEDFPGLVILSTNQRTHMDDAFARRFQSSVLFPMPDAAARLRLWTAMFQNGHVPLSRDIDFRNLAASHELAGGAITNVLRHACLLAVDRDPPQVTTADIMSGVKHELQKAGQYLT